MTQETRVLQLGAEAASALRRLLDGDPWTPRSIPHARWSVTGPGVAVTYYSSGKLVLQGPEVALFVDRYLSGAEAPASPGSRDDERIGSDEAGKGDYFGPLTVAAVYASPADLARLRAIGVADSKQLSDETVARIAAAIEASTPHAVVVLDPQEYNRRHAEVGNVNVILGELHAQAILEVAARTPCRNALVDRFGDVNYVRRALGGRAREFALEARPRAESHVAVAAASILARDAFLAGLRRLSDDCGIDLPKGAGDPVERIVGKVVSIVGRERLSKLAKVHFRTTQKILGSLFP